MKSLALRTILLCLVMYELYSIMSTILRYFIQNRTQGLRNMFKTLHNYVQKKYIARECAPFAAGESYSPTINFSRNHLRDDSLTEMGRHELWCTRRLPCRIPRPKRPRCRDLVERAGDYFTNCIPSHQDAVRCLVRRDPQPSPQRHRSPWGVLDRSEMGWGRGRGGQHTSWAGGRGVISDRDRWGCWCAIRSTRG